MAQDGGRHTVTLPGLWSLGHPGPHRLTAAPTETGIETGRLPAHVQTPCLSCLLPFALSLTFPFTRPSVRPSIHPFIYLLVGSSIHLFWATTSTRLWNGRNGRPFLHTLPKVHVEGAVGERRPLPRTNAPLGGPQRTSRAEPLEGGRVSSRGQHEGRHKGGPGPGTLRKECLAGRS